MSAKIGVDEKCVELARHFLADFALADEADVRELSERIQVTVEEFCEVAFNMPQPPEDRLMPNDKGEQFAPIDDDLVF